MIVVLVVVVGVVLANKEKPKAETAVKPVAAKEQQKSLPKMMELGAEKCVPCKMMMPIVEELQKEYKNKLEVVFIDVLKNSAAIDKYDIKSIPTQIFFDKSGKEFFRHTGFFSKKDVLKTFAEHGIKLD
ncbi:MAG: thioredoxin family protein [Armatimonadota bacterium]